MQIKRSLPLLSVLPCLIFLAMAALYMAGIPLWLKFILCIMLLLISVYEALKMLQKWPHSLTSMMLPAPKTQVWQLTQTNGQHTEAKLMNSSRVSPFIIILHFRLLNSKISRYQIILPSMLGKINFHTLLVYLKTH